MSQESLKTGSIDKFQLTASIGGKSVDLSAGITDFRIYESVLSNTVTATATVVETGTNVEGSIDGLPIRGGENLRFKIRDAQENFIDATLMVNRLRNALPESTRDTYILDFASPEYFANDTVRVTERYGSKISESVRKVLVDVLKTNKKLDIDDTINEYNFLGNDRKPFYTCTWLAQKSIPSTDKKGGTAGFLFYQTIDSFKFKSIDTLLGQSADKSFIFNSGNKESGDDDIIINYTIDRDIDLHENLTLGYYGCSGLFFDPVSFRYVVKDYDIDEQSRQSPAKTFAGDLVNQNTRGQAQGQDIPRNTRGQMSRLMNIVLDTGALPAGKSSKKELETWKNNPEQTNFDAENCAIQSIMRYNQLFTIQTTITIPGDFSIRAGDTVKCSFPKLDSDKNSGKNPQTRGIYMVAHVCHKITPENTLTSLSLVRDSYGK
mgnify:CR=1 FL=1